MIVTQCSVACTLLITAPVLPQTHLFGSMLNEQICEA